MVFFQLTEYLLWKSLKKKRHNKLKKRSYEYIFSKREDIILPSEMICRVCTNPADVPIIEKIDDLYIASAIRMVANISISHEDALPQYVCRNCLSDLKIALTFKKKCESSNWILRQSTNCQRISGNNNFGQLVHHDFESILHRMKQRSQTKRQHKHHENVIETITNYIDPSLSKEKSKIKTKVKKDFKCKRCDLVFASKALLLQHRVKQDCICPPCPLCGILVSNLERHKKVVHQRTETHTCHICGKIAYSNGGLKNHLLVHSDTFGFSCHLCPYKGKQQSYLTLHMRTHTGERPYLCSACPAKFVNPSNLRKHQLIHSSKKFECIKCKKQFRLQKTLQEHYDAAHLNVRYRCSICGKDLWTRRKLLRHELSIHNREKHKLYQETYKVVVNEEND